MLVHNKYSCPVSFFLFVGFDLGFFFVLVLDCFVCLFVLVGFYLFIPSKAKFFFIAATEHSGEYLVTGVLLHV